MFFLASLIFVALLYVVPGMLLLDLGARALPVAFLSPSLVFLVASAVLYVGLVALVRFGHYAYQEFQMSREERYVALRPFLDMRNCRWITAAALLIVGAQAFLMSSRWALPYQFWPLYGAVLIGLLDLRGKRSILPHIVEELPDPIFETLDPPNPGATHRVQLTWDYLEDGKTNGAATFEKTYEIREASLQRVRDDLRFTPQKLEEYANFVKLCPMEDIRQIALDLRGESNARNYSPLQEAGNVVAMVRAVSYATDEETRGVADFANFPVETLVERRGDCEDHAILAAALLWQLGHQVGLFFLELAGTAHMALAYQASGMLGSYTIVSPDGRSYTYMETVPSSAELGTIPEEFLANLRRAAVIPLS